MLRRWAQAGENITYVWRLLTLQALWEGGGGRIDNGHTKRTFFQDEVSNGARKLGVGQKPHTRQSISAPQHGMHPALPAAGGRTSNVLRHSGLSIMVVLGRM